MRCEDMRLERVLLSADEASAEFSETARHLEMCPRCRERLTELSGADDLVKEACETLRDGGEPTLERRDGPASIVVSVEPLLGDDIPIDCETLSLDFLEPASHPEMLGRIGRYEVERLIGAGGMGVVLKAYDTELHRVVAIKVLLPHLATSSAARRRFAREAKAAAAVVHEHVIPIYNVESEGPIPYLVMQFVPGHSLQARVDEHGPLEIKEVLRIARQAAAGLSAAHAQGVVHRDVKPANILLEDSIDRVLLSDFGLARTVDDATLTRSGVLAGTPHYMSPEQASGQSVDQRSDLFSLGSVIYFMCTGRPPYRSESPMAVLNRICHEPHRPVDDVNPDVPIELAELVDRLLAKNPSERFATAQEVETHLAGLLSQMQQGHRLRRRSWWRQLRQRHLRPGGPLLKRLAIGLAAAAVCMLIGAAVTHYFVSQTTNALARRLGQGLGPTESPSADSTPRGVTTVVVPRLPPDTFDRDVAEVKRTLESIESQELSGPILVSPGDSGQWRTDVSQLQSDVSQIEDSLGDRPSTPATDTPHPASERKE
jgi:eukaryotic-like serine/threonine-protein kinase